MSGEITCWRAGTAAVPSALLSLPVPTAAPPSQEGTMNNGASNVALEGHVTSCSLPSPVERQGHLLSRIWEDIFGGQTF